MQVLLAGGNLPRPVPSLAVLVVRSVFHARMELLMGPDVTDMDACRQVLAACEEVLGAMSDDMMPTRVQLQVRTCPPTYLPGVRA